MLSHGHVLLKMSGENVLDIFKNESGKHVVQRYPPTENRGRRHTSGVFVIVLPLNNQEEYLLDLNEVDIKTQGGSGPGGQNRNKRACAVRATHRPTNIQVFIDGRDQNQNKRNALKILEARVSELKQQQDKQRHKDMRKEQLGHGNRSSEKIRTYNFINCFVKDHRTGHRTSNIKAVMNGNFDLLRQI